jgi:plastocyanin
VSYGFEFTIPITLRRYFSRPAPEVAPEEAPADSAAPAGDSAAAGITPRRPTPAPIPANRTVAVELRGLKFNPARITIDAGTTVVWTNYDAAAHTVTANDKSFDSGTMQPEGGTWQYTFNRPGTYNYFCAPHPFMRGVVVVR